MKTKKWNNNKNKLLAHIYYLSKKTGSCFATTDFLSQILGICNRQVFKYLNELKAEGVIEINTSKCKPKSDGKGFYKKREIKVKIAYPANAYEIRKEYFQSKEQENNYAPAVEKESPEQFKELHYPIKPVQYFNFKSLPPPKETKTKTLRPILDIQMENQAEERKNRKGYDIILDINGEPLTKDKIVTFSEETKAICREASRKEELVRFEKQKDREIRKIIEFLSGEKSEILEGITLIDKLRILLIKQYRDNINNQKTNGTYDLFKEQHLQVLTENYSLENDAYYLKLYSPVPGDDTEFKVKLFDYVPWDENSWEFTRFKELTNGKY